MLAILDLLKGRRVIPEAPDGYAPLLPKFDADGWDEDDDSDPDLETIAGVGCVITYTDFKRAESVRRITCRKLNRKGTVVYLQALCHERNALRTFKIERIVEVACAATGELFSPATDFFARYASADDGSAVVGWGLGVQLSTDLRAGLNVLAFLARCDGRVVPAEQQVIADFCQSFAVRFAADHFDHDGACQYARQLAPDAETFYVSLTRLKRDAAPVGLSRLALQSAGRLIAADGVQDEKEFYFGCKVQEYLAA